MKDFISMQGVGTEPASKTAKEFAVQWHNGVIVERSPNEGQAMIAATDQRNMLKSMGIPELYWPVVVEREVSLVAGSWYGKSE